MRKKTVRYASSSSSESSSDSTSISSYVSTSSSSSSSAERTKRKRKTESKAKAEKRERKVKEPSPKPIKSALKKKRAPSDYNLFVKAQHPAMKKAYPTVSPKELLTLIAQKWRERK